MPRLPASVATKQESHDVPCNGIRCQHFHATNKDIKARWVSKKDVICKERRHFDKVSRMVTTAEWLIGVCMSIQPGISRNIMEIQKMKLSK